jgi:hypothetical protein
MSLSTSEKINATMQTIIAFLLVSLPFTYKITNGFLSGILGKLAEPSGCPTLLGLFIHSIAFGVIIYGLMTI